MNNRDVTKDAEAGLKLLVYTIESAIREMPEGVSQMVWMIDFKGFSISNSPPISQCMEILNVLANHYPERLGLAFIIDTPFIFNVFWVITMKMFTTNF